MFYFNDKETSIGFLEIPEEIAFNIVLLGCPNNCPKCHSQHNFIITHKSKKLKKDILLNLIKKNINKITCVNFMGGDWDLRELYINLCLIKNNFPSLKLSLYTGADNFTDYNILEYLDYIKIGHYDDKLGGLNKKTTNQKLYKKNKNNTWEDITYKFQRKNL